MNNNNEDTNTLELAPAEAPSEPFAREAEWIRREHTYLLHDAAAIIERSARAFADWH